MGFAKKMRGGPMKKMGGGAAKILDARRRNDQKMRGGGMT